MRDRMWAFVNSNFGLWCLSTLVIGSLSFAYTQYERRADRERQANQTEAERIRREEQERADRTNRLERQVLTLCLEVMGRTNQVRDLDSAQTQERTADQLRYFFTIPPHVQNAKDPLDGVYAYYPEFERRPLFSIVQEIEQVTYRQELNAVGQKMRKLYDAAYFTLRNGKRKEGLEGIRALTLASFDCLEAID